MTLFVVFYFGEPDHMATDEWSARRYIDDNVDAGSDHPISRRASYSIVAYHPGETL